MGFKINYSKVREIDNSKLVKFISRKDHKKLINGPAGEEHYKLLAYFSSQLQNGYIVELGTHHGTSSLAMSVNPTNTICTYDIIDSYSVTEQPPNVHRKIGNIFEMHEQQELLKADFIFVDTAHDGVFEWQVYSYLKENRYGGVVMFDDIHWSVEMKEFWSKVDIAKYDLTDIGHGAGKGPLGNFSGTGVLDFSGDLNIQTT